MDAEEHERLPAALRRFIRTEAEAHLADPDTTSIGVLRAADTLVLLELVGEREPPGSLADIRW